MMVHGLLLARHTVANAGISGSDVRDMMLEAVEKRFGDVRAPKPVERLSDNGSPYTAIETRQFAAQLNLVSCFTPIQDARTALDLIAGWFEDYNENHPHSGLRMRSPREFRRAP